MDRISTDPTISFASANRTPPVLPVCTWMILWRRSLKTLQLPLDFCLPNGPQRTPPNPPPEDCSLATEAEAPSTAKHDFSLHHNPKVYCSPVTTHAEKEAVVHHGVAKFQLSLTEEPTANLAEARATSHVDRCPPDNPQQAHIGWLHGTEPRGEEEALDCHGSAGEEGVAALEEAVGEVEEAEDLRGANSVVVGEGAEVAGADTFAPSPGEFTWAMTAAFHGNARTNQDIKYTVSMETWWDDVVATTYRPCVDVLCFVIMSCIQRIKVIVTEQTLLF